MTLRYDDSAKHIYDKLKKIPRTGWVIRDVPNPETVYDHTVSLLKLADELAAELGLSTEELDDLKHVLEVHDWAEAVAGDEYIPNDDQESYTERKLKKVQREKEGMAEVLEGQPYKDVATELWQRYETGADRIAKLAKELDKFQALLLAGEYEERYNIPLFDEFDQYYIRDESFSNPVIINKITELRKRFPQT
tara:strand:+ start:107 stop:685 length:579 start_codon:yes stop_codon:yes gene_type:complete